MDEAENSPTIEARSAKRARPDDSDAPHTNGSSHPVEAALPVSKQPAMHTKALRSVLKGACAHVYAQAFLPPTCCQLLKLVQNFDVLYHGLQCSLSRRVSSRQSAAKHLKLHTGAKFAFD